MMAISDENDVVADNDSDDETQTTFYATVVTPGKSNDVVIDSIETADRLNKDRESETTECEITECETPKRDQKTKSVKAKTKAKKTQKKGGPKSNKCKNNKAKGLENNTPQKISKRIPGSVVNDSKTTKVYCNVKFYFQNCCILFK